MGRQNNKKGGMKTLGGGYGIERRTKGEKRLTAGWRRGAIYYEEKENVVVWVASSQLSRLYLLFSSETLGKDIIISQLEFDSFLAV